MYIEPYDLEITDPMMHLLLMADPDEQEIRNYIEGASILIAKDSDKIIAIAVLVNRDDRYELMNLAVYESYQGKGIAKTLIMEVKALAKTQGAVELFVGTGNSSLLQLGLYQKCGFRINDIKTDFFVSYPEPIYENGIQCIDMIVLCAKL